MSQSKSCGSLHCQRDSYARSLGSVVLSCQPSTAKDQDGLYEIELEDTILFPEGGGQVSVCIFIDCIFLHRGGEYIIYGIFKY